MRAFDDAFELKIGQLTVPAGGVLVVKVDSIISGDMMARIKAHFVKATGIDRVVVIDRSIELQTLTQAEAESLGKAVDASAATAAAS